MSEKPETWKWGNFTKYEERERSSRTEQKKIIEKEQGIFENSYAVTDFISSVILREVKFPDF